MMTSSSYMDALTELFVFHVQGIFSIKVRSFRETLSFSSMSYFYFLSYTRLMRVNPEHKSCFKRVFCFNLRSFRVGFSVDESVMCPLTRIIKNFFNRFFEHFLTSNVHSDVKRHNTESG